MTASPPAPRRAVSVGVYAALFLGATAQSAITPLLPHIGHRFGLSAAAIGLLVAAPAITILALCVPIGMLADRLGARRLTIGATALMALAALGQAVPAYGAVLLARLVFGVAFGTLLTAGVAWLSQESPSGGGTARLGATVTSTSVGTIAGPAIGGLIGESLGIGAPFVVLGAASALVTLALLCSPAQAPRAGAARTAASLRELVAATRDAGVRAGAGALAISGAVGGATQLLVPLSLHRAHLSAGSIGAVFSIAAIGYIAMSAGVVACGGRAVSPRLNAIASLAIALGLVPAVASGAVAATIAVLLATALPRSAVGTLSYPLATSGGARSGIGSGVAIGMVNAAWAAGVVAAPLMAGALSPQIGVRGVYAVLLAASGIGALLLCSAPAVRRPPAPAAPAAPRAARAPQPRVARRSEA